MMALSKQELSVAFGLLLGIFIVGVMLWHYHCSKDHPEFSLLDLLMENGRISRMACVMMGAFFVTTWMMVYLTLAAKITEGYLGLYATAWIAPIMARIVKGVPPSTKDDLHNGNGSEASPPRP